MYYRQKILLALLKVTRKPIPRTKLHKMLFLLGQEHHAGYYHFFPHKYGCYSMVLDNDIRKLQEKGILQQTRAGLILSCAVEKWTSSLKKRDQAAIRALAARFASKNTKDVMRYVYLTYPQYASRSTVLTTVLSEEERNFIERHLLALPQPASPAVFSIGYEGLDIDQYIARLLDNHVYALVDVRYNPFSMKFGFTKQRLSQALRKVEITYVHLPEFGIPSDKRRPLETDRDHTYRRRLFQEYGKALTSKCLPLSRLVSLVQEHSRVALTCFEAEPERCHRHVLIEHLKTYYLPNVEVRHL